LGLTIPDHNLKKIKILMLLVCVAFLLLFCAVFLLCSFTLFLHVVVVSHCWGIVYCVVDANVIVGPSHYLCYYWFITLLVCCVVNAFIISSLLLMLLLVHCVANVLLVCCIVGVVVGPSHC
jgi:hypothetical protein